ncbi:uncharacterized protein LOC113768349 [Coffea eugenioides]|uniref:uncharacterized protein LOC113768349 n=1 Tax=Coffea eugenioides TaxID=49369 RepID=UPI000F60ED6D|nr:uncharacterized protein LOC113768349 [Coffea eugenioides]
MSVTTVITDSIVMTTTASATDTQTVTAKLAAATIDVDFAKCDCCGLTEECTLAYIERIRERYQGKWICGLCAEAVKDEVFRSKRLISTEEAMSRHFNFCSKFRSSGPPPDATGHLISAVRHILKKSLDSPKSMLRSVPCSPTESARVGGGLTRSESCIPSLNFVDSAGLHGVEGESERQSLDIGTETDSALVVEVDSAVSFEFRQGHR